MLRLIKNNYFLLSSVFFIFYFTFNFLSGERGFFSYIEKKELLTNLKKEELSLTNKIDDMDHKNSLLSNNLEHNYVEKLIKKKFIFKKKNETIYLIKEKNDETKN